MDLLLPCPAEKFIPHRKPMRFIDQLEASGNNEAYAQQKVEENHLFSLGKSLDPLAFVEMLAQLTAAHNGYLGMRAKTVKTRDHMGYLVGLKHFIFHQTAKFGDVLALNVKKETQFANVSYIKGEVRHDNALVAEGSLKLWEVSDEARKSTETNPADSPQNSPLNRHWQSWKSRSRLHGAIIDQIITLSPDADGGRSRIFLPADFIAFQGHFPEHPILPAVFMLKIAVTISELLSGQALRVEHIKVAKFARSILPGAAIDIHSRHEQIDEYRTKIDTQISEGGHTCSRMHFITRIHPKTEA